MHLLVLLMTEQVKKNHTIDLTLCFADPIYKQNVINV